MIGEDTTKQLIATTGEIVNDNIQKSPLTLITLVSIAGLILFGATSLWVQQMHSFKSLDDLNKTLERTREDQSKMNEAIIQQNNNLIVIQQKTMDTLEKLSDNIERKSR